MMAIEEKLEDKIHRTERKLKELFLHLQRLDREYQTLLKELDTTPEQLQAFAENPDNFSPALWEELQNAKKELEEKLKLKLDNVCDANKTKKTLSEKGKVQKHWLFVR